MIDMLESLKAQIDFFPLKCPINCSTRVAGRMLVTREAKSRSENFVGAFFCLLGWFFLISM